MYTSGSTGPPKGVLLTHHNVVSSLAGAIKLWGGNFDPEDDLMLAYLPLAHILEQVSRRRRCSSQQFLELTFFLLGIPIGYGTPKTLLDDSVRNCKGDFGAFRPVSGVAPHLCRV